MSFITKRERIFNEYDLLDLPPRNEGKLKAYASCTDSRAWSHFCSDKTEHLVEIIKRNNGVCRPKYLPTDVIVQTLMAAKNAEVARLKRKIEELEQMLSTYDQLELTCEQKCEIADAHAAIKAANKELDEMCLDLDLSGFTEGMDSDVFETGKSRGDEPSHYRGDEVATSRGSESVKSRGDEWNFEKEPTRMDTKGNQTRSIGHSDASTSAEDVRIQEMQDTIIRKDAKLNALRNSLAVMENDVCEPYCIYAHIYTAIEKIFGVLYQNDKYKLYLNQMTAGKDIRCIDIKGKILYKLKVLEKFSQALIAPCSQSQVRDSSLECECLRAEVVARLDFPLTSESTQPSLDSKRAKLVADIMANDEMKEILSKESFSDAKDNNDDNNYDIDDYSIDNENLKRLKNLQESYDDLMTCYENLKYEKDSLQDRCKKYEDLQEECENLKSQLREYNTLWNEKEHYRKRSLDVDSLKEQYLILADEASNLETQLKAESEINLMKTNTIDDLRNANIALEKKLNDALISFEKERNSLQCKLKETECTVMCQEQQIKSLSAQIDRFIEQGHDKVLSTDDPSKSLALVDEIESLKDEINNLKHSLFCSESEKQQLFEQFQDKLGIINDLKIQIEDWKSTFQKEVRRLMEENKVLSEEAEEKSMAIENLKVIIESRSQKINFLTEILEENENEKKMLSIRYKDLRNLYDHSISSIENEKLTALQSLHLAQRESEELLKQVQDHDISKLNETSAAARTEPCQEKNGSVLLNEIEKLRIANANTISTLQEVTKKNSEMLEDQLKQFAQVSDELQFYKSSYDNLLSEKDELEKHLSHSKVELDNALQSIQVSQKESIELMKKMKHFEILEEELFKLKNDNDKLREAKECLENRLISKNEEAESYQQSLNKLSGELNKALHKLNTLEKELHSLEIDKANLIKDSNSLHNALEDKDTQLNILQNAMDNKEKENQNLQETIQTLESYKKTANENIKALQSEYVSSQKTLDSIRKESEALIDKLKSLQSLEKEYEYLTHKNNSMKLELETLTTAFKKIQDVNNDLNNENQNLQSICKDLEQSLIEARNQLLGKPGSPRLSSEDILREVESLKKEKVISENKIKNLINKLDESENIITNLTENLVARDEKIAILENYINGLKDEISQLHEKLDKAIDAGEQISTSSSEKYDQTMRVMEARHSRAAHNIKMEIAKLENEKWRLEEQLSETKLKTEKSFEDGKKYLSQVTHLQNEKEIIVNDIKELEIYSVGDSALSSQQCSLDDIQASLDHIRKSIHDTMTKSSSLELSIQKVKKSSQILISKADEAKKIVEKEKQKIIMEKEDAVREKITMENKLAELKTQLENQISSDQETIRDLEARIQNQQLLAQNSISKLEIELQEIQSAYKKSKYEIKQLQGKVQTLSDENKNYQEENNILNMKLIEKSLAFKKIQDELDSKIKKTQDVLIQVNIPILESKINTSSQTDNHLIATYVNALSAEKPNMINEKINFEKHTSHSPKTITANSDYLTETNPTKSLPKHTSNSVNEVQILTADIEPSFDHVRSSYLKHKMQLLCLSKLEQNSFLEEQPLENSAVEKDEEPLELTDIYKSSVKSPTSETAIITNEENKEVSLKLAKEDIKSELNSLKKPYLTVSQPLNLKDDVNSKLLKESHAKTTENLLEDNHRKKTVKKDTKHTKHQHQIEKHKGPSRPKHYEQLEDSEYDEDDSVKPKLNISLPRVNNKSHSIMTTSEDDKESTNTELFNIYLSPKQSSFTDTKIYSDTRITIIKKETPSLLTFSNDNDILNSCVSNEMSSGNEIYHDQEDKRIDDLRKQILELTSREKNLSDDDLELIRRSQNLKEANNKDAVSYHDLVRIEADPYLIKPEDYRKHVNETFKWSKPGSFAVDYILNTVRQEAEPGNARISNKMRESARSKSDEILYPAQTENIFDSNIPKDYYHFTSSEHKSSSSRDKSKVERSVMAKLDDVKDNEEKIRFLTNSLEITEIDYKKKLSAIKMQYDTNIKNILNEHNQGVKNIQNLHEETLQGIMKIHENEVENLRSMSIEANRKAEKLERENRSLKTKMDKFSGLDEEPTNISSDSKKRRKSRLDSKILSKTNIITCNVKPKTNSLGPCTCALDVNISDTIKNIFDQVNVEQRTLAEHTYVKYIANKILSGNVEALDAQELSYLHLKVCRIWKMKLNKEEALQKQIDTLESELMNRQRHAQQHIAELDRKVEEEKRRLQEVREAVCRGSPVTSRTASPEHAWRTVPVAVLPSTTIDKDFSCSCNIGNHGVEVNERRSAGDLVHAIANSTPRHKRMRPGSHRAVLAKVDVEEKKERKLYNDEPPTRLRRSHDRQTPRVHKK